MCGIIGQFSFNQVKKNFPQLILITHRGPDGRGEWTNKKGNIYFGHTRLAILEPTPAGRQPMSDVSKRYTITFNGEIYNHLELRSLLPEVYWRGNSDTETLVELLSAKGLGTLNLLKGMFAFALYDSEDDSLLLVRDRLGIKPLWIEFKESAVRFSSELRVLIEPGALKFNDQALSEYIGFGRMPGAGEIIEGVQTIPSGGWIKINGRGIIEKGIWWPSDNFFIHKASSRAECVQQVRRLVITAVEEHLLSDVGVGAFLSGGIDSGIITLIAGKVLGSKLKTFTVGFPQKAFDERSIALMVAKKAGSSHNEIVLSQEKCLQWVKEGVLSLDLPSVDAINTYIVSKAVRETGLKVALSGLGGDELFGGYPSFRDVPLLKLLNWLPLSLSRQIISLLSNKIKKKLGGLTDFTIANVTRARRRFISVDNLKAMGLADGTPYIPPAPPGLDSMGLISWTEIQAYMIPMLLRDCDQMSMAVGLEIRVPFLDHRLVEEVLMISKKYKKGTLIKPLLVEAFQSELPREVYDRPKQGFSLPMEDWMKGPLADFTKEGIIAAAHILSQSNPIQQHESFLKGNTHWTRAWLWSVLGHWLVNQKKTTLIEL